MDVQTVTWNARRKGWMGPPRSGAPVAHPAPPIHPGDAPAAAVSAVVVHVPEYPCFSPAAIAALLSINRGTVHYYLENQKLDYFRDNIGERYVVRGELVRFIREYLRKQVHED